MPTTSPGSAASPAELKDMGNKLYTQRKYDEAIECYSAAIGKNSSVPTYFTNRALCYLKKSQWDLVIKDCKRALDLDPNLVKAHFFMGQALQELDAMDECVACLQRASDLARENKQHFGDDIAMATRIAKRKRWNALEEKRIAEEIELQSYMNKLLREEMERQLKQLSVGINGGRSAVTATTTTANVSKTSSSTQQPSSSSCAADGNAEETTSVGICDKTEEASSVIEKEERDSCEEGKQNIGDDNEGGDKTSASEGEKLGVRSTVSSIEESPVISEVNAASEPDTDDKGVAHESNINGIATDDDRKNRPNGADVDALEDTSATMDATIPPAVASKSQHVHPLTAEEIRENRKVIEAYHARMESELNSLFTEIDDRRKKREVPDYLCGKISFDILRDPVITPSGITYERRDIEEHIQRVGHFDPVTRVTLTQDQLVPNFALKDVVDAFVAENAWAVDF